MGDPNDQADGWSDTDDIDWVRLYALAPNLWADYADELESALDADVADPTTLARFIERCFRSVRCLTDIHAQLPGLGLTLPRFVEIREEAKAAEQEAIERDGAPVTEPDTLPAARYRTRQHDRNHPSPPGPLSAQMTAAIINLHLRGLDNTRIICAFDLPHDWPTMVITRTRLHAGAHAVVRAHIAGNNLAQITTQTGVPASSAIRILRQIGEEPHGTSVRVDARARARTIVKLRGQGLEYKQIADRLGCSMDTVKNVLRRDRRHRYGTPKKAS